MRFLKRAFLTILIVGVGFFVFLLIFPPYCMVEGTQVDTPSGSCNIEDLSEGEEVWTRAPSGELQVGRIRAIHPAWSMVQSMIVLSDGTTLNATAPHPVATETGWKPAGQLETGDSVWSRDGWRKVASVTHTGGLVRVFDLEVEPNSNFFANGVLVHNKSKPASNEDSAISAVRNIVTSQITYSATIGEGSYATSLTQLENAKLVDSVLGSGTKDGYTFRTTADKDTFTITARPLSHGDRNFYSDETGVIRYTREDRPAWFKDTPLGQ
ncbi:MAG: Hint domain-containing protein [Acidobacteria bacterium]|nr:Hint domain-containing protein [Acidobacteriota bacterium]